MRARNCMGALAIGTMLLGVSAYAAPRDGAVVKKAQTRANGLRLVTGTDAVLRDEASSGVVATGCGVFDMVPVLSNRPNACEFTSSSGNSATLSGNDCEIEVEVFISNLSCFGEPITTWQATVGPEAALPAGISLPAPVPCTVDADCTAAGYQQGTGAAGTINCTAGVCVNAMENPEADRAPDEILFEIIGCNPTNLTCGSAGIAQSSTSDAMQYAMTVALHVDAGATGSITIPFQGVGPDTFLIAASGDVPIGKANGAVLNIPTGRCCDGACTEDVTLDVCSSAALWDEGTACPQNGGPPCVECPGLTNAECADGDACTVDTCNTATLLCNHDLIAGFDPAAQCCDATNANLTTLDDGDPCTDDTCSAANSRGSAQHDPAADGSGCDDGNPCTNADICTGGLCAGHNVNGDTCTTDAECNADGTTPGAVCDNGACSCSLAVNIFFGVVPGVKEDPNCFSENEKVTVNVMLGASAVELVGGQFFIKYDPTCLAFNSIMPKVGGPWPLVLQQDVDEVAGTIFYAAGVNLGDAGTFGAASGVPVAEMSFTKLGNCSECQLCYQSINPIHTRLTDADGQSVQVDPKCSKNIRQTPTVTVDGPDSVKVNVACNSATREVTWAAPVTTSDCESVTTTCQGLHIESGLDFTDSAANGGVFPVGNTNFCCSAGNSCGNVAQHCWTVTVNDETCLDVEIQLSPTMVTKPGGGITRCIKFEVFSNSVQPPLVFEQDMVFGGLFNLIGHFNGNIKIPSQIQPFCITARDQLHTLRGCYVFAPGDCRADGCLQATFKGDPFFGGNWLVGGNLDGWKKDNPDASHDVIDILDFGQLVSQWLADYGTGDTPCGTDGPNADINGDGIVDILDFSFVSLNFLDDSKACCDGSGASLGNTTGRTSITVNELIRNGMKDLAVADLNADGVVDLADIQAFVQDGARPQRQAPARDGKGSSPRSFNR